jgi:hypothetical protein
MRRLEMLARRFDFDELIVVGVIGRVMDVATQVHEVSGARSTWLAVSKLDATAAVALASHL